MASSSLLWLLSFPADYYSVSLARDALYDKEEDRLLIFEGYKHKVQGAVSTSEMVMVVGGRTEH